MIYLRNMVMFQLASYWYEINKRATIQNWDLPIKHWHFSIERCVLSVKQPILWL